MYQPKFTITNEILKNIGQIEAAKEVIENAPLIPAYEKQFKSEAIIKTIHHGTHIEGNDLSLSQTKQVLEGQSIVAKERDIQEVINYRNVMNLIDELGAKRGGYDSSMLEEIHKETVEKIVPPEKAGSLRKTQVVLKEEGTGKVVFKPPSYVEVPFLLQDFFDWLNSSKIEDYHPILLAGIVHYVLVSIHPFVEGNGRTTRAFATLVLLRSGYDLKRFLSLEEHFDSDLEGYYSAFSQTDEQSPDISERDLTSWLEYFTKVVSIELTKIKERVRKLSIDSKIRGKIGSQITLSERQTKLVEFLNEKGASVMQELRRVLPMVSEDTILRDVTDLIEKKIVKKEGKTKAAKYAMVQK